MKQVDIYRNDEGCSTEYHIDPEQPTLRDRFAMVALPAIIQMKPSYTGDPNDSLLKCDCEAAYLYADGMLRAREEKL
jgi:hypothetical protein